MSRKMPRQKPGKSEQSVGTPTNFLHEVRRLLSIQDFTLDVAADASNAVCKNFITAEMDAFKTPWSTQGFNWLNPPFGKLEPWVKEAWMRSSLGSPVAMLVPAAVGSNWWEKYVHLKARVMLLNGRLTFVGHTKPYPRDCALLLYTPGGFWISPMYLPGYDCWRWKPETPKIARARTPRTWRWIPPSSVSLVHDGMQYLIQWWCLKCGAQMDVAEPVGHGWNGHTCCPMCRQEVRVKGFDEAMFRD